MPGRTAPVRVPRPGSAETEAIERVLTAFINTSIMARGRRVEPDDDLEAAGVDSMALLKILLFVEAEFGFWMPDEHLVDANLRSARTLADYICRHGRPS